MTAKEARMAQDARCFVALARVGDDTAIAMEIADDAGDEVSNTFCTPAQATASMKRLQKMGLVKQTDTGRGPVEWEMDLMGEIIRNGLGSR